MSHLLKFAPLLAALAPPLAYAADPVKPPPAVTDAGARVPQTRYESAFSGYQPYREQKLAPWREANEEAARIGGHIGILGGASGHATHGGTKPAVAPATSAKPAQTAPAGTHGGHPGMHK